MNGGMSSGISSCRIFTDLTIISFRNWNWKKIGVKFEEEEKVCSFEELTSRRLFSQFEEIGVLKEVPRSNHMDMGEFQKFLETHNASWAFNKLFGIER